MSIQPFRSLNKIDFGKLQQPIPAPATAPQARPADEKAKVAFEALKAMPADPGQIVADASKVQAFNTLFASTEGGQIINDTISQDYPNFGNVLSSSVRRLDGVAYRFVLEQQYDRNSNGRFDAGDAVVISELNCDEQGQVGYQDKDFKDAWVEVVGGTSTLQNEKTRSYISSPDRFGGDTIYRYSYNQSRSISGASGKYRYAVTDVDVVKRHVNVIKYTRLPDTVVTPPDDLSSYQEPVIDP